jgi:5-methylcytosine-specific restriction endonuclease McrBC regulatory subunit McrC
LPTRPRLLRSNLRPHRPRVLWVLADTSPGRTISPDELGIAGRDRSWNAWADSLLRVNRPQFESLGILPIFTPRPERVDLTLRPSGVVGAIPLQSPDSHKVTGGVVVRPRFGWNDIGPLLNAIGWSAAPQLLKYPLIPGSAREIPPWVLAGPIIQRIAALLDQLTRGFRLEEQIRQTPRGRIIWRKYAEQQMPRGQYHQLPCQFPELGPDWLMRSYLRWGLEQERASLTGWATVDLIARRLLEFADQLLSHLWDVPSRVPDHNTLDRLGTLMGAPMLTLKQGLEAISWILDERGLAGLSELDGLSWRLPMSELFERWVETIVRKWAHGFGGTISTAREGNARFPIHWERPGTGSLRDLAPDFVVQAGDSTYIFDAKYKGHFEELDDQRWRELSEDLKSEHRHDLHQALAYATLFDTPRVVTSLVYPLFPSTWEALASRNQVVTRAKLATHARQIETTLIGLPLQMKPGQSLFELVQPFDVLQHSMEE